jgi:hypothetical protein
MVIDIFTYQIIFHSTTAITLLVQIYATYLIITNSPKNMSSYRPFLLLFRLWDIIFTILYGVFLVPDPVGRLLSTRARGIATYISHEAELLSV